MNQTEKKIRDILDKIRPMLERDGGDLKFIKYDKTTGIVEITLTGACAHCPLADITLNNLIAARIKSELPEIKEVRSV